MKGKDMAKKNSPKSMTLGERIRQLRKKRNWSQEDLGNKIDIHWQTIGTYEKDETIPSALVLKRIAEALEVTTDYLLFGDVDNVAMTKITDRELLRRVEVLDKISPESKDTLFKMLDMFIRDQKVKELSTVS